MKQCNKCNEVKEPVEFSKSVRDGLQHQCKSCANKARRAYHAKNKELENKKSREYNARNKEKLSAYLKDYKAKNKKEILTKARERYRSEPVFRLTQLLRGRLRNALNGNSKSASTLELLGCTAEHARFHIESQFTEGMTWENIHVDHIQPCASFDLEDPSEQRKCFHYSNLQPLFASDNLRKSDKIVPEHQVRLL